MKVDMSPAAVTARLELMDDLWELGTELQAAGSVLRQSATEKKEEHEKDETVFKADKKRFPQDL
jgi:hypothetical protein